MRAPVTTVPASRRATVAGAAAAVSGIVAVTGMALYGAGYFAGFPLLMVSLGIVYWQLNRLSDLRDIARVGGVSVDSVSHPLRVVRGELTLDSVGAIASSVDREHVLVRSGDHWCVASTRAILDGLVAGDGRVPVSAVAHPTRIVPAGTPVDHLTRLPDDHEIWLVSGAVRPAGLTRADLLRAGAGVAAAASAPVDAAVDPESAAVPIDPAPEEVAVESAATQDDVVVEGRDAAADVVPA